MRIDYNFFFHPLADDHTDCEKALSTVTVIALSVLTAGVFAIIFAVVQCYDWSKYHSDDKTAAVASQRFQGAQNTRQTAPSSRPTVPLSIKAARIKEKHTAQLQDFETWARQCRFDKIRDAHYDWWMFPVNQPSRGYGDQYAVSDRDVATLKTDPQFMNHYRRGIALVVQAWGWDIEQERSIERAGQPSGPRWDGYGVRLAKMSDSLKLFGEHQLHHKLKRFYREHCLPRARQIPITNGSWVERTLGR